MHVVFGTGPLGQSVAAHCVSRGDSVRIVNRRGIAPSSLKDTTAVETVAGDLSDLASAREAARGATVIYHCAGAPYTDWPETLPKMMDGVIAAAESSTAVLVYGDNVYAYGPTDEPMTEDTPERPTTRKGRVRKQVADTLRAAHEQGRIQAVIGRASDFYGPDVHTSSVGDEVFGRLAQGKAPRVLGDPSAVHSFTYIEDFGRALVLLAENPAAYGETWHVPNAAPITTRAFAQKAAEAMGKPNMSVTSAPSWLLRISAWFSPMMREVVEMLYQWERPFVVDHSKFDDAFGDTFGEPTPIDEGIAQTAASYQTPAPA